MIQNILLATDGSAPAERAADFAASLALRFQATVTVLTAFTPAPARPSEPHPGRPPRRILDEARALVEAAARRLREMGIQNVGTEVMEGPAANVILGVAETRKPDLIVIGARGASTWQGHMLGGVSIAVTLRAECPVLVVK
jgi:nucleotide-binding universal stress UspA family protein